MCGIVGYLGRAPASPILLDLLAKLEHRGYDSCGVAIKGSPLRVFKGAMRVKELADLVPNDIQGTVGIGHTRWATHGGVTQQNAHPHTDCTGSIAVVHNGILDNYHGLRTELVSDGHTFSSQTDTEVIAHLIEKHHRGTLEDAVVQASTKLRGSWAIVAVSAGERKLVAARQKAPLIIGLDDDGYVMSSDAIAMLGHATSVIHLEDGDIAVISDEGLRITHDGHLVEREIKKIPCDAEAIDKNGYEHYTLKEILEQPEVLHRNLITHSDGAFFASPFARDAVDSITIVACGTSYHAGLIGKHVIENMLGIPVSVINASEFVYRPVCAASLAIAITQSGETADVLAAARRIKDTETPLLAITNAPYSTITTLADQVLYTNAGPEIGVAATKTYTAQLVALFKLVLSSPHLTTQTRESLTTGLEQLPEMIRHTCSQNSDIEACARFVATYERAFIIGRGVNLPTAYEGALKLKELAYIHAEGYSAGELKHGPFALLDKNTPVIAVLADDETRQAMINNVHEVKARHAPIVAVTYDGDEAVDELCSIVIRVPRTAYPCSTIVNAVALQLLAYHAAKLRRCPIDFPRNIAKSVTVE